MAALVALHPVSELQLGIAMYVAVFETSVLIQEFEEPAFVIAVLTLVLRVKDYFSHWMLNYAPYNNIRPL